MRALYWYSIAGEKKEEDWLCIGPTTTEVVEKFNDLCEIVLIAWFLKRCFWDAERILL